HKAFPVFAEAFDAVCAELDKHLDRPIREIVFAPEGTPEAELLQQTGYTQPAVFALEVALYRLVEHWGVRPDAVAGHSIGELAAAHATGMLSLADAAAMVAARGQLMQALPAGGAMVAVQASEDEVLSLLGRTTGQVGIAAVNGPAAVVVSGAEAPVLEVEAALRQLGRKTKRLPVSHAFHSPLMEPMLSEFGDVVRGVGFVAAVTPFVSTLTGGPVSAEEVSRPEYWVRHVRETVRFHDAVRSLVAEGVTTFLEIGPDGVLSAMGPNCLPPEDEDTTFTATLRGGRPEVQNITGAVAGLHVRGVPLDWEAFRGVPVDWSAAFGGRRPRRTELPTYAFQRQRYWLDAMPAQAADLSSAGLDTADHPLLGATVELPGTDGLLLAGRLSLQSQPWLADHTVAGRTVLPGSAVVELFLQAGDAAGCALVEELTMDAPLVLPERGGIQIRLTVGPPGDGEARTVQLHSRPEEESAPDSWTCNASGVLRPVGRAADFDLASWPPVGAVGTSVESLYEELADAGLGYGPAFQGVQAAWRLGDEVFAEVALAPDEVREAGRFGLHPALLDSALHAMGLLSSGAAAHQGGSDDARPGPRLPSSWTGVSLSATGATALRVRIAPTGTGAVSVSLADPTGQPVGTVDALVLSPISVEQLRTAVADDTRPRRAPVRPARRAVQADAVTAAGVKDRLLALSESDRAEALLGVVRRSTAAVFGHQDPAEVDVAQSFKDIGIDSLTAVELRNQVAAATGLRLPPTVLFDCPTPAALVARLQEEVAAELSGASSIHRELDHLESLLALLPGDGAERDEVHARLRTLTSAWARPVESGADTDLASATAEDIFDLLDAELEAS
ncbi:acyltransferase domain-containing protein, partial [Kitasatospora herbaricolor]|uniref:acyltransferase domain-containing protein n=1 Tax=Kitasatospora herbaricolor TaxID=68217 RepID=UPI0036DE12B9